MDFDDADQLVNESKPCCLTNFKIIAKVSETLGVEHKALEKMLLFEKKKFLKEYTHSPFKKQECRSNRNTICRAIYNSIFEFIL